MEYLLFQEEEQNDNGSIFVAADKPNDNDLIKIYNFFIYKGYYNIVSIQFINLLTTIFLYFLFIFLVLCIDYPGLIEIKTQEENFINYINFGNILNTNFFYLVCMILMFLYTIMRIHGLIVDILKYKKIKDFYKNTLEIDSKLLSSTPWSKIIEKIHILYGNEYNSYNINARILRKENIMCDLYRTKIRDYLFSNLMEWNIYYCIFGTIMDENNQVKRKLFDNKEIIIKDVRMNIIIISILTFIFMPFLVLYMIFYCIIKYGAKFYNHPSKIASRQWSIKAKWYFRYYNELKHFMDNRLDIGSIYAKEYCSQFNSKVIETITKFLIFIASSFFIILLFLSLLNEHLLFNLNITYDKPIIWYMGILGSIIALGQNINHERTPGVNYESFIKLTNKIKYIPSKLLESSNSIKVRNSILKLYEYQIVTLLKECFTVILVPFYLIYLLNYVDSMLEYIEENLEEDNTLGYISSKSNFNNINDNSDLKTLISFKEHRHNFPDWGNNIEDFMVNSQIYEQIKNNQSIDENNFIFESHISIN
jgi:autophagy-related protein 9